MRRILTLVISMVALCVHSATQEEARRVVREAIGLAVQPHTPERVELRKQMMPALQALDMHDVFSVYCEILAERFDDPNPEYVDIIMRSLYYHDGFDAGSYGHQEALDWARKVVTEKNKGFDRKVAMQYLLLKGDERDFGMVRPTSRSLLAMRVAGTNLLFNPDPYPPGRSASPNVFFFAPSVTNTGPQGLYAEAILRQFWEQMKPDSEGYRDRDSIPTELLTMVVWFDEDGNPVCNVDLAKYGLTMPELDVPNKPKGKEKPSPPLEGERPREPETSGGIPAVESDGGFQPPEQTPPAAGCRRHVWLYAGIAVLTLGIAAALRRYLWEKGKS